MIDFFLEGVEQTAANAVGTAKRLMALFQQDARAIERSGRSASTALRVFQVLRERPLVTLKYVCERTGLSFPAVAKAIDQLARLGIVAEITGRKRDRVFAYRQYVAILNEGAEPL